MKKNTVFKAPRRRRFFRFCAKRYLRWRQNFEGCLFVVVCCLSQSLVIFRKGICTGFRHNNMLTGVLIKRSKNSCFDQKRTSFISDLGAVTVVSGSQNLKIFTKLDQFHQRVRGGNCGFRVPKMSPLGQSVLLASI